MQNAYPIALLVRVGLLLLMLVGVAYALVTQQPVYWLPGSLLVAGQVWELVRYLNRSNRELSDFLEGIRYHDFSQFYTTRQVPASVGAMRQVYNEINRSMAQLTREKEAQHLYVQHVLELVNTGILSYRETGEVRSMNESLKQLLQIPYLKTIQMLQKRNPGLYDALVSLRPGESRVVRIHNQAILLSATVFSDDEGRSWLVAFQRVSEALEENEAQAYQKILRVMTHEIMNSVAPIASLADTLEQRIQQGNSAMSEIGVGIGAIRKRSEGLLAFAQTYRSLSKLSVASFQPVRVLELFEDVCLLLEPTFEQRGLDPDIILKDPSIRIEADKTLIEQVLINLITNALDALREQQAPELRLEAYSQSDGRIVIEVADNGKGMSAALVDEIFVPFFTTKKSGSGIGLSLSRQLMQLHRGSIQVQSIDGAGSVFQLVFQPPVV